MTQSRLFAIIPAAGLSQRMGQPKLLLRWRGKAIIEHVLSAWQQSRVTRTLVVLRQNDLALRELCAPYDVDCVCPEVDPRDMKQSVQCALEFIAQRYEPAGRDAWLLAPADMPKLSSELIDRVLGQHRDGRSIVVPRCGLRTGHPVLFPWPMYNAVFQLAENEGLNRLMALEAARGNVVYVDQPDAAVFDDMDTAEDFNRL